MYYAVINVIESFANCLKNILAFMHESDLTSGNSEPVSYLFTRCLFPFCLAKILLVIFGLLILIIICAESFYFQIFCCVDRRVRLV